MKVTSREQKLIHALISAEVLTFQEMLGVTKTSKRTLYRDLERLSATLPKEVTLISSSIGYYLRGNISILTSIKSMDWTPKERLFGELILLILQKASIKSFDEKFEISQPTATADLKLIEKNLKILNLQLSREEGLKILGDERTIRQVLTSIFTQNISASELLSEDFVHHKLFSLIDIEHLHNVNVAFTGLNLQGMSDKTESIMRFFFFATLLRSENGHHLHMNCEKYPSKKALKFVRTISSRLKNTNLRIADIMYLAELADILHFSVGREVLYLEKSDTEFAYKIRKLIESVGFELNLEFERDDALYGLLYAHLKTTVILPELFILSENSEFSREIQKNNQEIYEVVRIALEKVFAKPFSPYEIAYITLHFVATLERSDLVLPLKALLLTDRGRIYSEFLVTNLKKNFPFIKQIEVLQSSAEFHEENYDIIFSTQSQTKYTKVDKVLNQENLDAIRKHLREIQRYQTPRKFNDYTSNYMQLPQLFQMSNEIIENFEILKIKNKGRFRDVILQMTKKVFSENAHVLAYLLEQNFLRTPFGLPDTNIALLHGIHESVITPYFGIFDLSTAMSVIAMDKSRIKVERLLLLLGPKKVENDTQYLLGKISSSIIENKLYTAIYQSGNAILVRELLGKILTQAIRNYEK